MDLQSQLRQFKDFLQLYNMITEHCFKHCVNTVLTRSIEADENSCLLNCVDKYANTNQAIMKTYVEVQGAINEKRMEDYNAQLQQQQENLLKEQQQQQESLLKEQQQQEMTTSAETPS